MGNRKKEEAIEIIEPATSIYTAQTPRYHRQVLAVLHPIATLEEQ
jgi:hypothetical protein